VDDVAEKPIGNLSKGYRQRVGLAQAIIHNPEVLVLDEPTSGLDPQVRREIYDIIEELRREKKTIVMTTHYIEEAERLCDRVAIVDESLWPAFAKFAERAPFEHIIVISDSGAVPAGTRLALMKRLADRYMTDANWQIVGKLEEFCAAHGHTLLELAFSWLAARPRLSSIIAGATRPEQVEQNVKAVDWKLTPDEIAEVDTLTRKP